jgi:kynurenine formamidase
MKQIFPYQLIDLTHNLSAKIPTWNGKCGFDHETKLDYTECTSEVKFRVQQIKMHAGIGTHIDAPSHCTPGAATVDKLQLEHLISPLCVIDVHKKATENYIISNTDILDFESNYGKIPEHSFVAFYTGWSKHWHNESKYHNNHVFPSICATAASTLITRNISGIGIDTLSPDIPKSGFPVHKIILGADKYIVENIANLETMPAIGAYTLVLPIKGQGLTESPVRMIGLINEAEIE